MEEKDFYRKEMVDQFHNSLSEKLIAIQTQVETGFRDTKERQDKTNGRVSKLERFTWAVLGALVILGLIFTPDVINNILTS